ncbi:uncharacterized protein LOC125741868 isoform X1 [Brienomyrus brachyistius]|uniref:uncharacterized protein LOC125741868 isoform X1 n=1 Tax=Brienomyrus brachyistius TaxID=42636 RepID=UPI0020B28054|nr:uncharacterized protein LOC125741868 isoform X1 [Brienomyrus brachyistius]
MESLHWIYLLGFFSIQAVCSWSEQNLVLQSPKAISLMKVNSTANIRCYSTMHNLVGLYLKRRFYGNTDIIYVSLSNMKININKMYQHRHSVTGQCCDFTFHLSQLTVEDSDSYYCNWTQINTQKMDAVTYQSEDTIIIVRERDPKEDCKRNVTMYRILILLGFTGLVIIVCVLIGVMLWCCTRTKRTYSPKRSHNQFCICPRHSASLL